MTCGQSFQLLSSFKKHMNRKHGSDEHEPNVGVGAWSDSHEVQNVCVDEYHVNSSKCFPSEQEKSNIHNQEPDSKKTSQQQLHLNRNYLISLLQNLFLVFIITIPSLGRMFFRSKSMPTDICNLISYCKSPFKQFTYY